MGDAKRKRQRKDAFLRQHPWCCFCGGVTPATTVDHIPSIQMFSLRRRPKGLEVPACESCNQATRQHEQVVAMLGRLYPDGGTEDEREETGRILLAVNNNVPGLLQEMMPSFEQQLRFQRSGVDVPNVGGVLNCNGPILNRSVQIFGGKLGLALHYTTTGRIISPSGGAAVRWFSNFQAATDGIPPDLFKLLGSRRSLKQGNWGVEEQFAYAYAVTEECNTGMYYCTFRTSFALLSWINEDISDFPSLNDVEIHRPGEF